MSHFPSKTPLPIPPAWILTFSRNKHSRIIKLHKKSNHKIYTYPQLVLNSQLIKIRHPQKYRPWWDLNSDRRIRIQTWQPLHHHAYNCHQNYKSLNNASFLPFCFAPTLRLKKQNRTQTRKTLPNQSTKNSHICFIYNPIIKSDQYPPGANSPIRFEKIF